jgi:DNA repair exonuclease SbcCD ATPase subunit
MSINTQEIRLTKLEESYYSLSAHLEGERTLRKLEDDKCKQLYDFLSKQILEIKEREPIKNFNEVFVNLKEELVNLIEMEIDSKILENKKQLEMQYINNIDKINLNKNILNDNYEKEIRQNKFEIEKTNKTMEIMNKTFSTKLEEISDQIKELYDFNQTLSNKIKEVDTILSSFQSDLNKIKKEVKKEIEEINNNINNKIYSIKNNIIYDKNNNDLINIDNNLSLLKSDFDSLSNNYLKEIYDLKNDLNQQNELKEKEMENFEQHFITEYENFTKFITDILNKNTDKIKSMNDYMNSDIEIIKNKNKYLEETLLKLREDVYDSIKQNIKYVLDKIHT